MRFETKNTKRSVTQKEIQNLINTCEGLNIWYEVINIVDEFSEG